MTIIQDIRSAARTLRRSPAFAAPIVLSPAFAIGETSQRSVWLTPFSCDPCRHQRHTLYQANYRGAGGITDGANDALYERVRERARTSTGSLLTFQDAAMKVVVDGRSKPAQQCGPAESA
jgi:hypothetical protein